MPSKFSTLNKIIHTLTLFFFFLSITLGLSRKSYAFSVGDEKKVGEKLLSVVRKQFKVLDGPDISQYLSTLGKSILDVTGHQFFDYHFFLIDNKQFNAFAVPSGLIFIHSGLLEAMDTEGELISVLAHECGHITSRHISDRIEKNKKINLGTLALLIAGIAVGGGPLTEALVTGSMATGASLNLKFSRQDEEEADRLAFKWMRQMDVDPVAQESMLLKMHKVSVYRMANIPPYLLTHPEPKRRMGYVKDLIAISDPKPYKEMDNFNFLRIKQRVMNLSKDSPSLKQLLLRKSSQGVNTESSMANYGLYLIYFDGAEYSKAEESLKKTIDFFPGKSILKSDLSLIYFQQGQYQKALDLLKEASNADPACAYTKYHLARTYKKTGDNHQALKLFESILDLAPDYSKLHYNIGEIYTNLGKNGAGQYHLGEYFRLEGDDKTAKYHLEKASASDDEKFYQEKAKNLLKKMEELEKE